MERCENRETTNTLLFGGLFASALEAPLTDWVSEPTQEIASVREYAADTPDSLTVPVRKSFDLFATAAVPESSSGKRTASASQTSTTPTAANPMNSNLLFGEFFGTFGDEAVLTTPSRPTPASPSTSAPSVGSDALTDSSAPGAGIIPSSGPSTAQPASSVGSGSPVAKSAPAAPIAPTGGASTTPAFWVPLPIPAHLVRPVGGMPAESPSSSSGATTISSPTSSASVEAFSSGPQVSIEAIDRAAGMWRANEVHGTSTGAFAVWRTGDLSTDLTVNYTVASGPFEAVPNIRLTAQ
jgi:hypothetical protein